MQMRKICLVFLLLAMSNIPAFAQDEGESGQGVIRQADTTGEIVRYLNPIVCDLHEACAELTSLLFPFLMGVDYVNGVYGDAVEVGNGLVRSWDVEGDTYTFTLRDDAYWSDGAPITAYDVLYSYFVSRTNGGWLYANPLANRESITGMLVDDYTIRFTYPTQTCEIESVINFPVIPSHVFEPNFRALIGDILASDDAAARIAALVDEYNQTSLFDNPVAVLPPQVTAGAFQVDETSSSQRWRFVSEDGDLAFEHVRLTNSTLEADMFLRGELNLILNPFIIKRQDIRAAAERGEARVFSYPGNRWFVLYFNFADPNHPRNAYDDNGNLIDQGVHPILWDVRVRQAIQKALDVQEIIDRIHFGEGTINPSAIQASSWAFDPDLAPIDHDLAGAVELLEAAGWIDENGDGIRECVRCQMAREGTPLTLNLSETAGQRTRVSELIGIQLRRVGIQIEFGRDNASQNFDLALVNTFDQFPVNMDHMLRYSRENDVLGSSMGNANFNSYYNAEVEALLAQTRGANACDLASRAEIYQRVQEILQEDAPAVWMYSVNNMVAVGNGVQGFDPLPHAPLWNIDQWVIVR